MKKVIRLLAASTLVLMLGLPAWAADDSAAAPGADSAKNADRTLSSETNTGDTNAKSANSNGEMAQSDTPESDAASSAHVFQPVRNKHY